MNSELTIYSGVPFSAVLSAANWVLCASLLRFQHPYPNPASEFENPKILLQNVCFLASNFQNIIALTESICCNTKNSPTFLLSQALRKPGLWPSCCLGSNKIRTGVAFSHSIICKSTIVVLSISPANMFNWSLLHHATAKTLQSMCLIFWLTLVSLSVWLNY